MLRCADSCCANWPYACKRSPSRGTPDPAAARGARGGGATRARDRPRGPEGGQHRRCIDEGPSYMPTTSHSSQLKDCAMLLPVPAPHCKDTAIIITSLLSQGRLSQLAQVMRELPDSGTSDVPSQIAAGSACMPGGGPRHWARACEDQRPATPSQPRLPTSKRGQRGQGG